MTGILELIRKLVGAGDSPGPFDVDILMHINSVFFILTQIGVGPANGFIATEDSEWTEFLGSGTKLELVKSYVYLKVKLLFDPPSSSTVIESMDRQITEYEGRLLVAADPKLEIVDEGSDSDE